MIGATRAGVQGESERVVSRWARRRVSVSELTGAPPSYDRRAAIIALALCHDWTTRQLADLFGVSQRWVQAILADFRQTFDIETA